MDNAERIKRAAWNRKWEPYRRASIQGLANPWLDKVKETIEQRLELLAEHEQSPESEFTWGQSKAVFLKNFQELLDGNFNTIKWILSKIDEGYFVDDALCTNGAWYDMKSYYEDLIAANLEQIEGMEDLLKTSPTQHIRDKVTKLRNINAAMQNKINTGRFEQPRYETTSYRDKAKDIIRRIKNDN